MSYLSIQQAADLYKKNKSTIYRDIKNGLLSASINRSGAKQIHTSELLRVYGEVEPSAAEPNAANNEFLSRLEKQLEEAAQREKFYQSQIDKLQSTIDTLTNRLTYQPEPNAVPTAPAQPITEPEPTAAPTATQPITEPTTTQPQQQTDKRKKRSLFERVSRFLE